MSKCADLPLDIVDMIFEELRPEEDAVLTVFIADRMYGDVPPHPNRHLTSCSLVSRNWRELSLRHLFHSIAITIRPDITNEAISRLEGILFFKVGISDHVTNLKTLKAVRDGFIQYPSISKYVTNLTFRMHFLNEFSALQVVGNMNGCVPWLSFTDLVDTLNVVPLGSLRHFTLQNVGFDRDSFKDVVFPDPTINLRWLRIVQDRDYNFLNEHLGYIYQLFASIDSLLIEGMELREIPSPVQLPPGLQTVALSRSLVFDDPSKPGIETFEGVSTMEIRTPSHLKGSEVTVGINWALTTCQSTLHTFKLEFFDLPRVYGRGYANTDLQDLNLSMCHHLHTLHLEISVYSLRSDEVLDAASNNALWSRLATVFRRSPPALRELTLIIHQEHHETIPFELESSSIRVFENTLMELPNLQRIHLVPRQIIQVLGLDNDPDAYTRSFVDPDVSKHRWCDARFPEMLFARLWADGKVVVHGGRPSKVQARDQWNTYTSADVVMERAREEARRRSELGG